MLKIGLLAHLEAQTGKEDELADFLIQGLEMANRENTTPLWFALRLSPSKFAIFDAFENETGRQNHLNGPIAKALMANASKLLAAPPKIEKVDIVGAKVQP